MRKQPIFEKSFITHEKSKYWSSKNTKIPRDVYKSTRDQHVINTGLHVTNVITSLN